MEPEIFLPLLAYPFEQAWNQLAGNPGSRYFWPFILGGVAFAFVMARLGLAVFYKEALTWRFWTGPSARTDYLWTALTPLIRVVIFGGAILWASTLGDGLKVGAQSGNAPIFTLTICLTVTLFVADDFVKFFMHWMMHKVPFMWSFHRVHHAAEGMTFATADRQHFMEIVFVTLPLVATYALVNGLFVVFTGIERAPFAMAGANIFLVGFNSFAGAFRHGPAWVSFGPYAERWLISPAMHQIHHSASEQHFDKNMGSTLALWDRLFDTHYSPDGPEELADGIGLGKEGRVLNTIGGTIFEPFVHAIRTVTPNEAAADRDAPAEQGPAAN